MEEKENFEEQPSFIEGSSAGEIVEKTEKSEAERGVPIGKFKSVEDLYQAYNNLQSEFTKKCQKLSELEKDKMQESAPQRDFDAEFKAFLLENPEAYSFAEEVKSKALQNEQTKAEEKPFDKVWKEMIIEKISAPNRAQEPVVQALVLGDDELKNLVIENYMKQLQNRKNPIIMSSNSGERVTKPVTPKPDSFEKAKEVVLSLLS